MRGDATLTLERVCEMPVPEGEGNGANTTRHDTRLKDTKMQAGTGEKGRETSVLQSESRGKDYRL